MSVLTESLERILNWLEQNQPSFASALEPGLSKSEIREMVEHEFPFYLPMEFYELYQWRNGTVFGEEEFVQFFPGYTFNSLEYALDLYADQLEYAESFAMSHNCDSSLFWSREWLPIFTVDNEQHLCILGNKEASSTSSLVTVMSGDSGAAVEYTSLTGMMQTIAECYETGAYYLSEDGDLEVDEAIAEQIRIEYNEGADF